MDHSLHLGEEGGDGLQSSKAQIEGLTWEQRSLFLWDWKEGEGRRCKKQASAHKFEEFILHFFLLHNDPGGVWED